jgi:DUF971 family protein
MRPIEINLKQKSRLLQLSYEDGQSFELPLEYLRVNSPSAEVQGHGPGEAILVTGKRNVGVLAIHPVGHYAILLEFDDGHRTGIYSFKYLRELGEQFDMRWTAYLQQLADAKQSRDH